MEVFCGNVKQRKNILLKLFCGFVVLGSVTGNTRFAKEVLIILINGVNGI